VRPNERRMGALLTAWVDAASAAAGAQGPALRSALRPLAEHFLRKLRTSGAGRRARGAPRTNRRAVAAAIDRVSDAFLAIDTETGKIADANPAAGALLGVKRDALLGVDAMSFVPTGEQDDWWSQLDAIAEGNDQRRFAAALQDVSGGAVAVAASVTRFATRDRTLALVLARPR
ncbi:MAG: PAS domain-containing protein, partial [Proteobacteria bacterium]|nr:PAS domain-containing protein [Pseudomonadota bacterium]